MTPTIAEAKNTYYEQVEMLPKVEWLPWVEAIHNALLTGDERVINSDMWLDWVKPVYLELKEEKKDISFSDSN